MPSGYSIFTSCSFDPTKNKLEKPYEKQKVCHICKKEFDTDEFDTNENDKNEF